MCAAATAAKSLQSCLTLCDPVDGSPQGSPVPGILQARVLEWGAIAFSSFTCSSPVFPALLTEEGVFSPLYILSSFVKDKVPRGVWVYYILIFYIQKYSPKIHSLGVGGVCNFLGCVSSHQKFEVTDPRTDRVTALGQISVTAPRYSSVLFRK